MTPWFRKKIKGHAIAGDLKKVTELAGDQIAPGMGTYALVLGGLVAAGVGAYVIHQRGKNKKADK